MTDYCALCRDKHCILYADYQLTRHELEEANELCHGNWIEIQKLYQYIDTLKKVLREHTIPIPAEY